MLKIYTGYAWREMKPEEVAAGDVYEEEAE